MKIYAEIINKRQISQSNQANKHQKKVFYNIENKIWLFIKKIGIDQPFKKLDYKMISFFKIIKKKSISLELQFFQAIKIHNIFHLNLF